MLPPAPRRTVRIGDTAVTYLPDGEAHLVPDVIFPSSGRRGWDAHAPYLDVDGRLPISIGAFLVEADGRRVLVDLGLGRAEFDVPGVGSFRGGDLLDSLADCGLTPEDIDCVLFTHLHHDHVGWTSDLVPAPGVVHERPGRLTFAGAAHLVAGAEWTHWLGTNEVTGPDPHAVQQALADRITLVEDGDEIAGGVRVLATPGHTPGHLSLLVTDPASSDRLLVLGDVMHTQAQVSDADWPFLFDNDPEAGILTRKQLLTEYRDEHTLVAGGHFAGTVFGRLVAAPQPQRWAAAR